MRPLPAPPARLSTLLRSASDEDLRRLLRRHGAADRDELERRLCDPAEILARWNELDLTVQRTLAEAMVGHVSLEHLSAAACARRLQTLGLAIRTTSHRKRSIRIPAEVAIALADVLPLDTLPLIAPLGRLDPPAMQAIAESLGIRADGPDAPVEDRIDLLVTMTTHLLHAEQLESLLDSLSATARNLLLFASQWAGAIPLARLDEASTTLTQRFGDAPGARHVLTHFGLLHRAGPDAVVLPADLNLVLFPLLQQQLAGRCAEAWERLRMDHTPAYRDVFPRGIGGDALAVARYRVLRALRHDLDLAHPMDAILHHLGLFHSPDGDLHSDLRESLDASGPEPFGREILRIWAGNVHPAWDGDLISALDGDPSKLLVPTLQSENARCSEEVEALMTHLHIHLLFVLGVLPPGYWFRLDRLAEWAVALYRQLAWRNLPPERSAEPGLPAVAIEVTSELQAPLLGWLRSLLSQLFEPLAAVRLDESGALFMVNTEPLRVLRDEDEFFAQHWSEAEHILGDDIDLWIPRPIDHGPRVRGVGTFRWNTEQRLVASPACHFADLLLLASWGEPHLGDEGLAFELSAKSVSEPLHERVWWLVRTSPSTPPARPFTDPHPLWNGRLFRCSLPADAFLLWLCARGAPAPPSIRARFPLSVAAVDGSEEHIDAANAHEIERWIDELRWVDAHDARPVLEMLRSWGPTAAPHVVDELHDLTRRNTPEPDRLFYLALLAGELGLDGALPSLQRIYMETENQILHDAATIAMARIGLPSIPWLLERASISNPEIEDRFMAVEALAVLAILHPQHAPTILSELLDTANASDLEPSDATELAVRLAETGHPDAAQLIHQLHERQLWAEDVIPLDEALWINSVAPAIHGRAGVAPPLAGIFNPITTAEPVLSFLSEWGFGEALDPESAPPWDEFTASDASTRLTHTRKN
jgi:hypothetical protein